METASSSILSSLRFCGCATADAASTAGMFHHMYGDRLCRTSLIASPRNHHYNSLGRKFRNRLQSDRFTGNACTRNTSEINPPQKFAVLLEVEGIGWPTSVATSEKGTFMKQLLREKKNALDDLVTSEAFPLRPGAEEFFDNACEEGIPVVILTAYCTSGEEVARSIVEKLGTERTSKIKIVGEDEVKKSCYRQLVFGKGAPSNLDGQLTKEASKAASAERHMIAEEVASMLKLKVDLNNSSSESLQNIVAALISGAEYAQVPIYKCVLIGGSQHGVAAAMRINMPCVVLRSSSTLRAEFPSAVAVMDGFGGADLTISGLSSKIVFLSCVVLWFWANNEKNTPSLKPRDRIFF